MWAKPAATLNSRFERPCLGRGLLILLGSGALLDGVDRLGFAVTPAAVVGAFAVVGLLTGPLRGKRIAPKSVQYYGSSRVGGLWISAIAVGASTVLLGAEVAKLLGRGLSHGFPIWLSDLTAEDNSSWIMMGTASPFDGSLKASNFSFGILLLKGVFNGWGITWAAWRGLPLDAIGVQITAVGFTYLFLIVSVPLLTVRTSQMVWRRTSSRLSALSVGSILSLFLLQFFIEVRNLGHLSAGWTTFCLVYSVIWLTSSADRSELHKSERSGTHVDPLALWLLSLSCLLWFPLRPLSLALALVAVRAEVRGRALSHAIDHRGPRWVSLCRTTLFLIAVVIRFITDLQTYVSPSPQSSSQSTVRTLISATGATYKTDNFYLLLVSTLVLSVLALRRFGSPTERLVMSQMALYVVIIRFADLSVNNEFQYGSTKMLWILLPPLLVAGVNIIVRDFPKYAMAHVSPFGACLASILLFANSSGFYSVVQIFDPLLSSAQVQFHTGTDIVNDDLHIRRWDGPQGLDLRMSARELPVMCVMIQAKNAHVAPIREFEPYRCTRILSEMSFEHSRPRQGSYGPALDELWKGYALLKSTLNEGVFGAVESGNDLSREVLIIDEKEAIIRKERVLDFLSQVTWSGPVRVTTSSP